MKLRRTVALALSLAAPLAAAAEEAPKRELWAGHQVVVGARDVPVLGDVETRTDSFVLAEVERAADGTLKLVQRACRVAIAPAAGVKVSFLPGAEPKLPPASFALQKKGDRWYADFLSGWKAEDADGDGKPGATMEVDAPLCSGKLFVTSDSRTKLRGREERGGLVGETRAISDQKTLDAEGACLKMMASDTRDAVEGTFAYAPVPEGTTCEALLAGTWPVKAAEPRKRRR
ncbi:hypothetical protein [Vulgatibacter sp.]|uniref:hypothetical protein n=1 Tax=Vulgatibacter sp. TaxID=1971226 RepID=UPI003568CBBA